MKSKLLLWTLALALGGCTILQPKPPVDGQIPPPQVVKACSAPGGAPKSPPEQKIPDTGELPLLPASTHIVVGLCSGTNAYTALGVDTQAQKFSFLITGSQATWQQALLRFHQAGVPVTVYPQPVTMGTGEFAWRFTYDPCKSLASGPSPNFSPSPKASQPSESSKALGPISSLDQDPPPTEKPDGSQRTMLQLFEELSWKTACSLDAVSDPAPSSPMPL